MNYLVIFISFIFVNNFILSKFLGLCPFIGVSKNTESAVGMGFAVTFVMALASIITWCVYNLILVPLGIQYLRTITFILVIASLVQIVEMVIRKISPSLYKALGIYLPLITTNCAVLGIAILAVVDEGYGPLESFVAGISAGLGFLLILVIMSTIREDLETEWVPKPFRGVPIAFIIGGIMAMAFIAFDDGMIQNLFPGL